MACEGFAKSNTIQISFNNKIALSRQKTFHCCSIEGYTKCKLYKAINMQYEK